MNYFKSNKNKGSNGFTLLVAMIVTALILAIGFSIGNIILKELALSASGKRSQIAFYAADSMSECALYWDKKGADGSAVDDSPFATSTPDTAFIQCGTGIPGGTPGQIGNFTKAIDDDGNPGTILSNVNDAVYATSSFAAGFTDPEDPTALACGEVTVAKNLNKTVIEARGYNVGYTAGDATHPAGCDISNPKTVERGIKVDY